MPLVLPVVRVPYVMYWGLGLLVMSTVLVLQVMQRVLLSPVMSTARALYSVLRLTRAL